MQESAAAGIPPHIFWQQTPRETFATLKGDAIRRRRERQLAVFASWHAAAFERQKRLPDLAAILRKMEPPRVMSPREQRASIMSIAKSMGARVVYVKKNGG